MGDTSAAVDEDEAAHVGDTAAAVDEAAPVDETAPVDEAHVDEDARDEAPFPGGPEDGSVLITYADHVATRLWRGIVSNT